MEYDDQKQERERHELDRVHEDRVVVHHEDDHEVLVVVDRDDHEVEVLVLTDDQLDDLMDEDQRLLVVLQQVVRLHERLQREAHHREQLQHDQQQHDRLVQVVNDNDD